jgi:hypothetical protein
MMNTTPFKLTHTCLLITLVLFSSLLFAQSSIYDALETQESFVEFGLGYKYSDNLYKTESLTQSGSEKKASLAVVYQSEGPINKYSIHYRRNYADYNEKTLTNDNYWVGKTNITQQLFSKNLILDVKHLRHRYLLNDNLVALPSNQGNRDLVSITPIWRIPYSKRAGFELSYGYQDIQYSDNQKQKSVRNSTNVTWFNALNKRSFIQIKNTLSTVKFPSYNTSYDQLNTDLVYKKLTRKGQYLLTTGYTQVDLLTNKSTGLNYELTYQQKFKSQSLAIGLTKKLTDSSAGLGVSINNSGDFDFSLTRLLWRKRAEIIYRYEFMNQFKLTNTLIVYNDIEKPILSLSSNTNLNNIRIQGISDKLNWSINRKLTASAEIYLKRSDLINGGDKKNWDIKLRSKYRMSNRLYFTFLANYIDEDNNQIKRHYYEWQYSTKFTYRY